MGAGKTFLGERETSKDTITLSMGKTCGYMHEILGIVYTFDYIVRKFDIRTLSYIFKKTTLNINYCNISKIFIYIHIYIYIYIYMYIIMAPF